MAEWSGWASVVVSVLSLGVAVAAYLHSRRAARRADERAGEADARAQRAEARALEAREMAERALQLEEAADTREEEARQAELRSTQLLREARELHRARRSRDLRTATNEARSRRNAGQRLPAYLRARRRPVRVELDGSELDQRAARLLESSPDVASATIMPNAADVRFVVDESLGLQA